MDAPGTATVAPYGSWSSPITTELIVSAAVGLGDVWVDERTTWWSELRPTDHVGIGVVRSVLAAERALLRRGWRMRIGSSCLMVARRRP